MSNQTSCHIWRSPCPDNVRDAVPISKSWRPARTGQAEVSAMKGRSLDVKIGVMAAVLAFLRFFLPFSFVYSSYSGSLGEYCSRCFSKSAE